MPCGSATRPSASATPTPSARSPPTSNATRGGSFVAVVAGEIVGTILCGHDGRRGYIHHLYVAPESRQIGLGRQLVDAGLDYFRREGLGKCHLFIFATNERGKEFWRRVSFVQREDLDVFSFTLSDPAAC